MVDTTILNSDRLQERSSRLAERTTAMTVTATIALSDVGGVVEVCRDDKKGGIGEGKDGRENGRMEALPTSTERWVRGGKNNRRGKSPCLFSVRCSKTSGAPCNLLGL